MFLSQQGLFLDDWMTQEHERGSISRLAFEPTDVLNRSSAHFGLVVRILNCAGLRYVNDARIVQRLAVEKCGAGWMKVSV